MNVVEKSTSQPILSEKPLGLLSVGRNLFPFFRGSIKYNIAGQMQIDLRDSYSFIGSLSANLEWCGVVVESHRKDLEIWKALKSQQDSTQTNDDNKTKGG